MRASDPRLQLIASVARVRPPHVHHTYHAIAEMGKAFDAEAFAAFAQLELRHVEAIVTALTERGMLPLKRINAREKSSLSKLSLGWSVPLEWYAYARDKRLWTDAEIAEEADEFRSHFLKTGQAYANWEMAWQGWVRRSRRPNGMPVGNAVDHREAMERTAATYDRLGRADEAAEVRREIARLNVVPIRARA